MDKLLLVSLGVTVQCVELFECCGHVPLPYLAHRSGEHDIWLWASSHILLDLVNVLLEQNKSLPVMFVAKGRHDPLHGNFDDIILRPPLQGWWIDKNLAFEMVHEIGVNLIKAGVHHSSRGPCDILSQVDWYAIFSYVVKEELHSLQFDNMLHVKGIVVSSLLWKRMGDDSTISAIVGVYGAVNVVIAYVVMLPVTVGSCQQS